MRHLPSNCSDYFDSYNQIEIIWVNSTFTNVPIAICEETYLAKCWTSLSEAKYWRDYRYNGILKV